MALDFRVTALEENGGRDGNSSVAELEERVEVLGGTVADHETRISAVEADVNGKQQYLFICYMVKQLLDHFHVFNSRFGRNSCRPGDTSDGV